MNITKIRVTINVLSLLALVVCVATNNSFVSIIVSSICLISALTILGKNINLLSKIEDDNIKSKTLKFVTGFDAIVFLAVLLLIILNKTGKFVLSEENESVLASSIVSIVILVLGNISPKLPRSRYTGLRLPWTVADETTWVVAHRILGYTSIPFGVFNLIVGFSNIKAEFRNEIAMGTFVIWVLIASVVSGIFFHKTR